MDIGGLFRRVWPIFTQNLVTFLLAVVVAVSIQLGVSMVLAFVPVLGQIASLVLSPALSGLFTGGLALMAGKSLSGAPITLSDLFVPFKDRQLDYVVVGLAVFAGILGCGVGVFVTSFLFMVSPVMVADGMGYEEALKRGYEMVMSDVGGFLLLFLAGMAVTLLTCGLLWPLSMLVIAQAYIDRKPGGVPPAAPAPHTPQAF